AGGRRGGAVAVGDGEGDRVLPGGVEGPRHLGGVGVGGAVAVEVPRALDDRAVRVGRGVGERHLLPDDARGGGVVEAGGGWAGVRCRGVAVVVHPVAGYLGSPGVDRRVVVVAVDGAVPPVAVGVGVDGHGCPPRGGGPTPPVGGVRDDGVGASRVVRGEAQRVAGARTDDRVT